MNSVTDTEDHRSRKMSTNFNGTKNNGEEEKKVDLETTTDVIMILDTSGSMQELGEEPLQSLNSFIRDQQDAKVEGATLSLWYFDTKVKQIIDDRPLADMEPIVEYAPQGLTALYDGIGQAVTCKLQKRKNRGVVCVVITDGEENNSKEFTNRDIRNLIKRAEEDMQWKFVFMGSLGIDAQGEKTGFSKNRCTVFSPRLKGGMTQISRHISTKVAGYRSAVSAGCVIDDLQISNKQTSAPAVLH